MITSSANEKIKRIRALNAQARARREQGCFVAEGLRLVREIPKEAIEELYVSASFAAQEPSLSANAEVVEDALFSRICDTKGPQGILAVARMPRFQMADLCRDVPLILVLEHIQDPGNLGTMIRTAEAAGATGVLLDGQCADLFSPKVVRATMGGIFRVPHVIADDLYQTLEELTASGIRLFAAALGGATVYTQAGLDGAAAFLIGNEGNGLSERALAIADHALRIPMEGEVESLNAAVAAALLLYEAHRQRA